MCRVSENSRFIALTYIIHNSFPRYPKITEWSFLLGVVHTCESKSTGLYRV